MRAARIIFVSSRAPATGPHSSGDLIYWSRATWGQRVSVYIITYIHTHADDIMCILYRSRIHIRVYAYWCNAYFSVLYGSPTTTTRGGFFLPAAAKSEDKIYNIISCPLAPRRPALAAHSNGRRLETRTYTIYLNSYAADDPIRANKTLQSLSIYTDYSRQCVRACVWVRPVDGGGGVRLCGPVV